MWLFRKSKSKVKAEVVDSGALNCATCSHGRDYWLRLDQSPDHWFCPECEGSPMIAGSGRPDHQDYGRAKMIQMFGPKRPGDVELLKKYEPELKGRYLR